MLNSFLAMKFELFGKCEKTNYGTEGLSAVGKSPVYGTEGCTPTAKFTGKYYAIPSGTSDRPDRMDVFHLDLANHLLTCD